MAFNLLRPARFCLSLFKKKMTPLRSRDHKTPQQLYASLSAFEAQLSPLELKKMPKALESFGRRFRRLLKQQQRKTIDVEMQLSQTYESYSRNVDELTFGSEELEQQTSLEQIRDLTAQMLKFDLNTYLKALIPAAEAHASLSQRLLERFINIEERVSREIFKGYFGFSRTVSKVAFLEEREYKGDFQFQLVDSLPRVELAIEAMYHCAIFNKLRDKLALACELAFTKRATEVTDESMARLLFCLANAGRSLKFIEENYHSIRERMERYPLELLYYMMVSGLEDAVWFQMLSNNLVLTPKNAHEQSIARMVKIILAERFSCFIVVEEREEFARGSSKHEGEIFFQAFLQRYGYEFTSSPLPLFPYTVYRVQGKSFLCYDSFAVKDESFSLSGAGLIITQYFHERSEGVKHVNWPRMMAMGKRGERDEYIFSKFKGIERPKREKVRYYE